jgi:hypothetical protein
MPTDGEDNSTMEAASRCYDFTWVGEQVQSENIYKLKNIILLLLYCRIDSNTPNPPSASPLSYLPFLSLSSLCVTGGVRIRIRIRIQEGKKTHKNVRKLRSFMFRNAECSLLRGESFCCALDVFYGGLGIIKLQFFIKKIQLFFLL